MSSYVIGFQDIEKTKLMVVAGKATLEGSYSGMFPLIKSICSKPIFFHYVLRLEQSERNGYNHEN